VGVICGDWKRVTSPTATYYHSGITGIFIDAPYPHNQRDKGLYAEDHDIFEDVWKYAIENGNNPKMRIAVCGLDDGRSLPAGWTKYSWTGNGGYGRLGSGRGRSNAKLETIWFSPHCLRSHNEELFGQ
jgi:DNA adenine methylase